MWWRKRLTFGEYFTRASLIAGIQSKMINFRWIWVSLAKTAKDSIRNWELEIMQIEDTKFFGCQFVTEDRRLLFQMEKGSVEKIRGLHELKRSLWRILEREKTAWITICSPSCKTLSNLNLLSQLTILDEDREIFSGIAWTKTEFRHIFLLVNW